MGVDVDFEYVRAQNREGYAEFVGELRAAMNEKGYRVSQWLWRPRRLQIRKGCLEGIDYALLGEQADRLFLDDFMSGDILMVRHGSPHPYESPPGGRVCADTSRLRSLMRDTELWGITGPFLMKKVRTKAETTW